MVDSSAKIKIPPWINEACISPSWNETSFANVGAYFQEYTPCFNDIAIVGLVHLSFFVFLSVRCHSLCSRNAQYVMLTGVNRIVYFLRFTLSLIAVILPAFVIVIKSAAFSGSAEADVYSVGKSKKEILTFEVMYYAILIAAYAFHLVVVAMETFRYTILKGQWILRFVPCFAFLTLTVRVVFIIDLYQTNHKDFDFMAWLAFAHYGTVGLLALIGVLHWPSDASFVETAYRYVPVYELIRPPTKQPENTKVCPEASAGIISTLFFSWITPLVNTGYKSALEDKDVWLLSEKDQAKQVQKLLEANWQKELLKEKPSLRRALVSTFGRHLFVGWLWKCGNDASQFVGPIILQKLINNSSGLGTPWFGSHLIEGLVLAAIMFIGQLLGAISECQYFQNVMRIGMNLRSGMILQIFNKASSLSPQGREANSSGKIANLISSDCENLQSFCQGVLNLWSSPIRIIVSVYLLTQPEVMGPSGLTAIGIVLVMLPLLKKLVTIQTVLLKQSLKFTDERVKLQQEVMGSIEVVKCYAWEASLLKRVMGSREAELLLIKRRQIWSAISTFSYSTLPVLVTVFTFLVFTLVGGNLTASRAFTALSLFSVLRMPLISLPNAINSLISALVAVKRLEDFFTSESLRMEPPLTAAKGKEDAISIAKSDFKWSSRDAVCLHDIELRVTQGELVTVIGATGMGKSSLLSAILGEMMVAASPIEGNPVRMRGSVSYIGQQAWIYNATVRENILFGLPYDAKRYQHAIWLSSLVRDFELMLYGDLTEIGEKGVNLSGGQKQRVSIARAVYANSDIILMDDPLSALDAHVAKEIYERLILGHFADKTVVFCTNRLEFVGSCDKVIVMDNGQVAGMGRYSDLMETNVAFQSLMHDQGDIEEFTKPKTVSTNDIFVFEEGKDYGKLVAPEIEEVDVSKGSVNEDPSVKMANGKSKKKKKVDDKVPSSLISSEVTNTGVGLGILTIYANALGGLGISGFICVMFVAVEGFRLYSSIFLKQWANDMQPAGNSTTSNTTMFDDEYPNYDESDGPKHGNYYYIGLYAAICVAQAVSSLLSALFANLRGVTAARNLHFDMFHGLMRAPMAFFHATPQGRIINRLSKDTADIDRSLVMVVSIFIRGFVQVVGCFIIIGMQQAYTLVAFAPVLAVFFWTYRYFESTNLQLKRLDSVARSPIYSYFGQCLQGLPTIRAYNAQSQVAAEICNRIDLQSRMSLALFSSNRWLSLRLEFLGGVMILFCAIFLVIGSQTAGAVDAGTTGLALTYALQITSLLNMTVRLLAMAQNSFNAVERLHEYSGVKSEKVEASPGAAAPPRDWPAHGRVEFTDVSMKYRPDLPPVLNSLSFVAEQAQKIGIVGRTGAGKSSTFLTLFRIVEASTGKINIDGIDISTLSMYALRSKLSIIPQEPVLFTGSIRFNLDPFDDHADSVLWSALERSHLKSVVQSMPDGMDSKVVENGENFSVGQRQLLCLARALIRRSSILVLDEATAAVDVGTDALIQKTIREEFAHCTVLAIAHRLNTIIDSDRVLVLDAGKMVEFGSPAELLANPEGVFSAMVDDTGDANSKFLRSVAAGEVDFSKDLSAKVESVAQATRMQTFEALAKNRYEAPPMERARRALLTVKDSIFNIQNENWGEALESQKFTESEWLVDLRSIMEQLIIAATHKIGDEDTYHIGDDYDTETLHQSILTNN